MKIIIEEHGGMVSVDFKGPDKNVLHAQELLMMATIRPLPGRPTAANRRFEGKLQGRA